MAETSSFIYRVNSNSTTMKEKTMKYLCSIYIEEKKLEAMPKGEIDTLMEETGFV